MNESKSESEDEFDQKLARARQAGSTDARKKKKAKEQQAQQQGTTTAKKLTKLEKFQQKKSGYEMSITAIKRTLAIQVKKAFELFEFILGEDASERWREIVIRSVMTTTGSTKKAIGRPLSMGSRGSH